MYDLISEITDGKIEENKNQLREYEDKIYTIDGRILSSAERIDLSIAAIREVIDSKKYDMLNFYEDIKVIKDLDLRDEKNVSYAKKKISIMQAKLGLKNTFFYGSYLAFNEIYTNSFISYVDKKR